MSVFTVIAYFSILSIIVLIAWSFFEEIKFKRQQKKLQEKESESCLCNKNPPCGLERYKYKYKNIKDA